MQPANECTQNHLPQPHATTCKALLKFSTFDSDPDRALQILTASMGPMGLRHVWPFVLAPSGRSWQTHAWGCCQHVWALCHALGCTLPGCFGVLTLFGGHLSVSMTVFDFGGFLPFSGSWHAATAFPWPLGLGAPKSMWPGLPASPKRAPRAQQAALQHGHQNAVSPF